MTGMTLIVKNTARLVAGFIAVFGIYIALSGHASPGGGFAGGVIVAASGVLVVLAFGGRAARPIVAGPRCRLWQGIAALGFLLVALCGYLRGGFFVNFIPAGAREVGGEILAAGSIVVSDVFILVNVAAGLVGAFLALAAFRAAGAGEGDPGEAL